MVKSIRSFVREVYSAMKSKKDDLMEYLLPIRFWRAFSIHVLILACLFYVSLSCLYILVESGGYVSAVLNEIKPEEVMRFEDAFSSSFYYQGSSMVLYPYSETEMSCSGIVSLTGEDGSVYTQSGALIHFGSLGKVEFHANQNALEYVQVADFSVSYIPPNSHTEYTLSKKFGENYIFRIKNTHSAFMSSDSRYAFGIQCNKPLALSLIGAFTLDDSNRKIPIEHCTITPSSDDTGIYISLSQNNHLSGSYSFYMPLSGTLDMIIDYANAVRVCGSGTLYYSDTASEKEYAVHRREIICRNDFFSGFFNREWMGTSEAWDSGNYNIHYSYTPEEERLSFDGEADYISISGYNIVLRSPSDWIRDNPYLLPSAILTVFGGAISLTLSDKARKVNSSASKRRPINRTSAKRRMLHMIKSLRRK